MSNGHAGLSWNLTMAVVWIASRSSQAVDRWKEAALPALTMDDAHESDEDADLFNRLNPARNELWRYLDGGEIAATAINDFGNLVEIEPRLWARLVIKTNSLDDFQRAENTTLIVPGTKTMFISVELHSADVVRLWPPTSDPLHMLRQSLLAVATQLPDVDAGHILISGIEEAIRQAGGTSKLTPAEDQIWRAIQDAGGESALPSRRQDRIKVVEGNARGVAPSSASIDRFFRKFGTSKGRD